MPKPQKNIDGVKKPLSAKDRKKAILVADVDMYIIEQKNKFTQKVMLSEHYMVISAVNGKRYVFLQQIKASKSIIT